MLTDNQFVKCTNCLFLAEIGVGSGDTSELFARHLNGRGILHLFDYAEKVALVKERLNQLGFANVVAHGNSHKIYDDYNWSLMKLIRANCQPVFDYAYIDGAHTWHHDACAFFLIDRLLKPGGFVEIDDYGWSHDTSPTVNPRIFPEIKEAYTDEQISTCQVALVVDLLLKRDWRYKPVVTNRIYRKAH
jgi:SAM-dependent methyltransferase